MYKEIDPRVIENYLIENKQLEYAEHFSNLVDYLYELDKKLQSVKLETTPAELEAANHRIKELEGLLERASWLVGNPGTNISSSIDIACENWQKDYKKLLNK